MDIHQACEAVVYVSHRVQKLMHTIATSASKGKTDPQKDRTKSNSKAFLEGELGNVVFLMMNLVPILQQTMNLARIRSSISDFSAIENAYNQTSSDVQSLFQLWKSRSPVTEPFKATWLRHWCRLPSQSFPDIESTYKTARNNPSENLPYVYEELERYMKAQNWNKIMTLFVDAWIRSRAISERSAIISDVGTFLEAHIGQTHHHLSFQTAKTTIPSKRNITTACSQYVYFITHWVLILFAYGGDLQMSTQPRSLNGTHIDKQNQTWSLDHAMEAIGKQLYVWFEELLTTSTIEQHNREVTLEVAGCLLLIYRNDAKVQQSVYRYITRLLRNFQCAQLEHKARISLEEQNNNNNDNNNKCAKVEYKDTGFMAIYPKDSFLLNHMDYHLHILVGWLSSVALRHMLLEQFANQFSCIDTTLISAPSHVVEMSQYSSATSKDMLHARQELIKEGFVCLSGVFSHSDLSWIESIKGSMQRAKTSQMLRMNTSTGAVLTFEGTRSASALTSAPSLVEFLQGPVQRFLKRLNCKDKKEPQLVVNETYLRCKTKGAVSTPHADYYAYRSNEQMFSALVDSSSNERDNQEEDELGCVVCHKQDEEEMLMCDLCQLWCHVDCCQVPVLNHCKDAGEWHCATCSDSDINAYTMWIPLQATTPKQGILGVVPSSHQWTEFDHHNSGSVNLPRSFFMQSTQLWKLPQQLELGDVIIFNIKTVHAATKNQGKQGNRMSLDVRFTLNGSIRPTLNLNTKEASVNSD